jgi:hypothetical protein
MVALVWVHLKKNKNNCILYTHHQENKKSTVFRNEENTSASGQSQ